MSKRNRLFYALGLVVLLLASAGCGGGDDSSPDLIGAYPARVDQSGWVESLPDAAQIVYHATIDLQVRSVPNSVEDLKDLAHEHGGYLTSAQTWYDDHDENATVVIGVPAFNFDLLYDDVLRLGTLESESLRGELEPYRGRDWDESIMSTITVHLSEKGASMRLEWPNWHAANTFEQAFGVASALFRFLLDAVIWIVVVVGPFVLLGWGARKLWQRSRKPQPETQEEES